MTTRLLTTPLHAKRGNSTCRALPPVCLLQVGLFSLGGLQALAALVSPLCTWLLPHQTLHPPFGPVPAHAVLSLAVSTLAVAVWLIFRSSPWAWVLQDLLGISLIIMVLRQFRLPDIKVLTLADTAASAAS